jgi:iron complex transport system ATP-binding protein
MDKISNIKLSFESLKIGYISGKTETQLLPPLKACASKGELIAVIGKNGIGKSTLLRTLTGIQPPLGGEIFFEGKNIKDYSRTDLALKVGYISTEIVKVTNMRVYDLVALGRFPHTNWMGKIESKDHEAVIDALRRTSMDSFSAKYISELSDGERQKVMISRILAQDTGIMIMDEPTAFLDVAGKYEIFHLMNQLSNDSDKTIIFSTHDLQMAISQSDKIWLILDDKLIEGAPEDLMIAGAFDHLFNSSAVIFNSEDGTFSYRNESRGSIYIEGSGDKRFWTEKAVTRAGFTVASDKSFPFIEIPSNENNCWKLSFESHIKEFPTVYELITSLKREVFS